MSYKKVLKLERKRRAMLRELQRPSDMELSTLHSTICSTLSEAHTGLLAILPAMTRAYYLTSPEAQSLASLVGKIQKLHDKVKRDYELTDIDSFIIIGRDSPDVDRGADIGDAS